MACRNELLIDAWFCMMPDLSRRAIVDINTFRSSSFGTDTSQSKKMKGRSLKMDPQLRHDAQVGLEK